MAKMRISPELKKLIEKYRCVKDTEGMSPAKVYKLVGENENLYLKMTDSRYKEAKDDLFLWYFEILEKNEIKIYPKKMTYNQMMEECKKNDIYIIKPLYSLGYTYNNNREDFKNYN